MKGYFTVEAALVFPLAIGIYLFLIYGMLYQYDRCLLEQDIGIMALRGTIMQSDDKKQAMADIYNQITINTDKYIFLIPEIVAFRMEKGKVTAIGEGNATTTGLWLRSENNDVWSVKKEVTNKMISPMLFLRTCRKATDILNNIEGEEKEENDAD